MKLKDIGNRRLLHQSVRTGLLLVLIAILTLEATAILQYYFTQKGIREEASMRAESQLEATQNKIMDVINQTEAAVRNSVWITRWALNYPDSLQRVCQRIVEDNPVVVGSSVALIPGYDPKRPLFAPYVFKGPYGLVFRSLATEAYDYPAQEWFRKPIELDHGYWSEPYIDEGGGDILMTTFSMPVKDEAGRTAAVLTADISLDWLTELVGNVKVYPNAFSMMVSRTGQIMVCPAETLVMKRTVGEIVAEMEDSSALNRLNRSMLSGESGSIPVRLEGAVNHVYFAPVDRTGWSMSIIIPDQEIYGGLRRIGGMVKILQLLGLAMLVLILYSFFKNQIKYQNLNEKKEKMEGELHIAHNIQMSMIPKTFPPFPERHDLDMAATLDPAREVGGDLYDYFIQNEKLYFCLGDVSGKGVPASLVMAVTRSIFRTVSAREDSPSAIVTSMNESMSDMNENNMFVTFFCGVLDLRDGLLRYCNAGHNPPVILTDSISRLPVEPNIALGILPGMVFQEQETILHHDDALFLYTDGLVEAENAGQEQFGEERMKANLHGHKRAIDHLRTLQSAIADFVGEAPQSDDLTMLFIHYLGGSDPAEGRNLLTLDNRIEEIRRLPEFVDGVVAERNLDPSLTNSLNLALEEAVTNVILYAYPEGTEGKVRLEAAAVGNRLQFILSDNGSPFDPTAAPEADTEASMEERPIGGLGIHLIRQIMDGMSYERKDGENRLTMIKYI